MKKGSDKKVTIDQLAAMMNRRFDELGGNVNGVQKTSDERFKIIVDEFGRLHSDVRDIKTSLGPLLKIVAEQERDMDDLKLRVARLEHKTGLAK